MTAINGGIRHPTKVLVIGGSYAGLAAAMTLLDLCRGNTSTGSAPEAGSNSKFPIEIKLVDERDGYYHLIGSPLALASGSYTKKAWMKFDSLPALKVPSLTYIQGTVSSIDCETKVAKIQGAGHDIEENYDYLVASSGLRRVFPVVPQSLTEKHYLREAGEQIEEIKRSNEAIVVIGGGAVGIEMAAELKLIHPTKTVKLIQSRDKLLSSEPLPDDLKDQTLSLLEEAGVEVTLSHRVTDDTVVKSADGSILHQITLSDGSQLIASHVIWAISKSVPTTSYLPKAAVNTEGLVKIDAKLNFNGDIPNPKHHFATGDLVAWSGIKRCGAAMAMGHNAAFNIHQQMLESQTGHKPEYIEFPEVPPMIALAVGKKAIAYHPANGTQSGTDVMQNFFGDDLGLKICYDHLRLGVDHSTGSE